MLVFWAFSWVGTAGAQRPAGDEDPLRFILWTGEDVQAFGRFLVTKEALFMAGGIGAVVVVLSTQDETVTHRIIDLSENTYPPLKRVANEIGNVKAVRPMALMLFLGSLTSNDRRFQDAAFTSLESILLANMVTSIMKGLVGRSRPYQNDGATQFQPLSGNTSFPSGHATTVFAFTTPWLLYYGNYQVAGLFLMGVGTAFTRMADKAHWLSDVLVGASIGFGTGYWLSKRHQQASSRFSVVPIVSADQPGISVRLQF